MRTIITSAVAVLVLGTASAQAHSIMEKEVVVYYDDLNVATPDGAQALYARVQIAAAEVCGYQPVNSNISAMQAFKACSEAAEARAFKTLPFDLSGRMNGKTETVASR